MARKVDEAANFVCVRLIEQEPGIYNKFTQTLLGGTKRIWLGKEFLMT
jgi:hypothetical protein